MNEDEGGITPANVTSITIDRPGRDWRVIIEQGKGDVIKMFELTEMERIQLGLMLDSDPGKPLLMGSVSFVDFDRPAALLTGGESWTPAQIEEFRQRWDSFTAGSGRA